MVLGLREGKVEAATSLMAEAPGQASVTSLRYVGQSKLQGVGDGLHLLMERTPVTLQRCTGTGGCDPLAAIIVVINHKMLKFPCSVF